MIVGLVRALSYRTSFITKELHLLYINHDGDDGLTNISKRQSSSIVWKNIRKNMSKKQQRQLYPSRCPCCDTKIDSMHNCVNHLSSAKHITKMKEMFHIKDECRPNIVSRSCYGTEIRPLILMRSPILGHERNQKPNQKLRQKRQNLP